jgi:uncharacterized membrane protein YcaP (DUF421 family)
MALAMLLDTVFGPTGQTTWNQECARAAVVFFYGLLVVRIAGRRAFAQWTPLDIIVAIVTGSSLSRALTGNADLFGTLAATTLMMALHWVLARASARWAPLSWLVEGRPVRLALHGETDELALRRHGVSRTTLDSALRAAGVESPGAARLIVLEPSGRISVLKQP